MLKMNPAIAVTSSFAASAMVSLIIAEVVYKPLARRGAGNFMMFVATIACSLILRSLIFMGIVRQGSFALLMATTGIAPTTVLMMGNQPITDVFLWSTITTVILVFLLHSMMTRTKVGKATRSVANNVNLSWVTGVNVRGVQTIIWAIAGGLAGVAGSFWAIYLAANPLAGWTCLFRAFAASALGGLTSFTGTIIGGFIVSGAENLGMGVLNSYFGVDVGFKDLIVFAVMVGMLLIKPGGLSEIKLPKLGTIRGIFARIRSFILRLA
jgi:branched-subunit amino acid ABC-type transport system permease component